MKMTSMLPSYRSPFGFWRRCVVVTIGTAVR